LGAGCALVRAGRADDRDLSACLDYAAKAHLLYSLHPIYVDADENLRVRILERLPITRCLAGRDDD
jgi:hypothetical protein